jgi:hypothetical protein
MRSVKHLAAAAVGLVAATIVVQTGSPVAALEGNRERVLNAYSRLPLAFVETRGPDRSASIRGKPLKARCSASRSGHSSSAPRLRTAQNSALDRENAAPG